MEQNQKAFQVKSSSIMELEGRISSLVALWRSTSHIYIINVANYHNLLFL